MKVENYDKIIKEARSIAIEKNKLYGDGNLIAYGEIGLVIRLSDKFKRLENLFKNYVDCPDETKEDTLLDIINYCNYLVQLRRGLIKDE